MDFDNSIVFAESASQRLTANICVYLVLNPGRSETLHLRGFFRIKKLLITDTIETHPVQFLPKREVVSVAPLFREVIKRIHNRESISGLLLGLRVPLLMYWQ